MSLKHAILGFLNYEPKTGYELKQIFDTSVQHFWPADQSQIYRTLSQLEKDGWVEKEIVVQEDRPNRKVFSITGSGRDELHRWLTTPLPFGDNRSAPMIQVFFAGQLSNEEIIQMYQRAADFMRAGLQIYDQIPQTMETYADYVQSPREFFFWMQTLEIGKMTAQINIEWIENMIARIKNGEIPEE